MDHDDDGLEDEEPVAPLLPADDRIWRHPSEVTKQAPPLAAAASRAGVREPRLLTAVALTSAISVLITLGMVALLYPLRTEQVVQEVVQQTSTDEPNWRDVSSVVERLQPAVVQLQVADGTTFSGVIVRSDGMVLTAHHRVGSASAVRARLYDGRELSARVVGADPETDIAVLDLEGERFIVAPLGNATRLRVGEPAITVGVPAHDSGGPEVTVGVISGLGRHLDMNGHRLLDMIQTDHPVAPGCSGGAVVDPYGAVIAIATMNLVGEAGVMGYAVPIDIARVVADQIADTGQVSRVWLGVEGDDVLRKRAKELGIEGGAVVRAVRTDSPAQDAGLLPTDVIVAVDGTTVPSWSSLVVLLRSRQPGDLVRLTVLRDGAHTELSVTLGERPPRT